MLVENTACRSWHTVLRQSVYQYKLQHARSSWLYKKTRLSLTNCAMHLCKQVCLHDHEMVLNSNSAKHRSSSCCISQVTSICLYQYTGYMRCVLKQLYAILW